MSSPKLDFEMPPELRSTLERDADTPPHPSIRFNTRFHDLIATYNLVVILPEPGDKREVLAWISINEIVSNKILDDYEGSIVGNASGGLLYYYVGCIPTIHVSKYKDPMIYQDSIRIFR